MDDINVGLEVFKGFSGKLVQAVLGFAGTIVFARVLGPTPFGAFYFLQSIVFLVDRPIKGTGTALTKRISEADASRGEFAGTGVILVALGAVAVLPLLSLNRPLSSFTGVENAAYVFVAMFVSVSGFFISQRLMEGLGYIGAKVWVDTVRSALTLAAQLAFVLAGYGAAGMGYGLAAGTFLSAAIGAYIVSIRPRMPSLSTLRSVWEYARYSIPGSFVGKVYGRIDTLVLGTLTTGAFVGYYEVGLKLSLPAMFFSTAIASALFPKVSNLDSKDEDVSDDIQNAVSYTSVLGIPILFGAVAIPEVLLVTAYGPSYRPAAPFLIGLVGVQVLSSQVTVYRNALQGLDLPNLSMRINVLGLVVNLAVALGSLWLVGPIGVVVGSLVAELTQYVYSSHVVKRSTSVSRVSRPLFEQVLAGVGMFAALETASSFVGFQSAIQVVVFVGFGATVYFISLYGISTNFRLTVGSVLDDIMTEYT